MESRFALEIWKTVLGWPQYEVSNYGRVRNTRTNKILRAADCGRGYLGVVVYADWTTPKRRKRSAKVHRLVMEAFTGTTNPGMHIAHNNGDRKDNRLANLRWATIEDNFADRKKHGTSQVRKGEPRDKLTKTQVAEIRALIKQGWSSRALGTHFKVDPTNIDHIRNGRTWKQVPAYMGESK